MRFKGKNVIVTGGSGDLGSTIALAFAEEEANIAITGRNQQNLDEVLSKIQDAGRKCLAISADVQEEKEIRSMVKEAKAKLGTIDVLVNNVGISGRKAFMWEYEIEDWNKIINVNVRSHFLFIKHVLRESMLDSRSGRIVNISGTAGVGGYPCQTAYSVAKHGVISLTRTLSKEAGKYNIYVNAVVPGPIEGERIYRSCEERAKVIGITKEEKVEEYRRMSPFRRFNTTADVANTVLFLASDDYQDTGQIVMVTLGSAGSGPMPSIL